MDRSLQPAFSSDPFHKGFDKIALHRALALQTETPKLANKPLQRWNNGWLQPLERAALTRLVAHMPPWATPDLLTVIGGVGTLVMFAGYALSAWNTGFLWVASIGLVINWFGDSLDGNLARYRKIERPKYGYFLDNSVDVVMQFLLAAGIGLSGLIRWDLCFLALATYLMISILTFVRANVSGTFQLAYGGLGPTEMRALFILLNATIFFFPPERLDWLGLPMTYPNILSLTWSCLALVTFALSMIAQIRELAVEDPPRTL